MERKVFLSITAVIMVVLSLLAFVFLGRLTQTDVSARHNEKNIKMGAVYMTLNNPFYKVIDEEMRKQIENHGDVLLARNPSLNEARQEAEIQELIDAGIKVLFVNPVDTDNIATALAKAKAAGIYVIAIDTNVSRSDLVDSTVVSDNYLAGVQCAQHLLEHRQGGEIVLLTHEKTASGHDRIKGFQDTLREHPDFHVAAIGDCQGQLEIAMPVMERILQLRPQVDVVMALNDPSALGAIAALQQANRLQGTMVYGVDATTEARDMIERGLMTGTARQEPRKIAQLAVEEAYKALDGQAVDKIIKIPTVLITKGSAAPTW